MTNAEPSVHWSMTVASVVLLSSALFLWIRSIPEIDPRAMTDFGAVSIWPARLWIALALLSSGFAISVIILHGRGVLPLLHIVVLIAILHLTPALVYETVRYPWVWKHFGIIDFIQRHGGIDREQAVLQVYHNWPGFFLLAVWLMEALGRGMDWMVSAARYASPAFETAYVLVLIPLYNQVTSDRRLIWSALWIFLAGNWIGQDYFAPQALAYLLFLGVVALFLGPLRSDNHRTQMPVGGVPGLRKLVLWLEREEAARPERAVGSVRTAYDILAGFLIAIIVISHQLTPLAVICAAAALCVIGRLSLSYLAFALVTEVVYLFTFAWPYVSLNMAEQIERFGQGIFAARDRLADVVVASPGQYWVTLIGRLVVLLIVGMAVAGGFRRFKAGVIEGRMVVLVAAPFLLLANSYGGEVLFRIYFFALPFLAFLAAAVFFPSRDSEPGRFGAFMMSITALAMGVGFVFANNGKDQAYTYSKSEVDALSWLYETAPANTLVVEGAREYPSQFRNYEKFVFVPLDRESASERGKVVDDPEGVLVDWLSNTSYAAAFVVITRSQKFATDAGGKFPDSELDKIERTLLTSPQFTLVHATADAKIFALAGFSLRK